MTVQIVPDIIKKRLAPLAAPLHLHFDRSTHPDPAARTAAWADAMSLSVDVSFTPAQRVDFAGSLSFYPLGPAVLVDARCTSHTAWRNRRTISRTGSAHVLVDMFPEGGFTGTFGGRPLVVSPGDCVMMDFRRPLRVSLTDCRFIGFVIPRVIFDAHAGVSWATHGVSLAAKSPEARLVGPLLEALAMQASELSAPRAAMIAAAAVGMIVACFAQTGQALRGSCKIPRTSTPLRPDLARVLRYIEREASKQDFNPDALAQAFGLSRTGLYRLFAADKGPARAIRRRRAHLARDLFTGAFGQARSIAEIAQASGFADVRTLARALRETFDATPLQLRSANASRSAPSRNSIDIGAMLDTTEW